MPHTKGAVQARRANLQNVCQKKNKKYSWNQVYFQGGAYPMPTCIYILQVQEQA